MALTFLLFALKRRTEMEIRKTRIEELDTVLEIYSRARAFMEAHGNPNQWKKTRPGRSRIEQDIVEEKSYVCVVDGKIAAVFYFAEEEDPTYDVIYEGNWLNDRSYAVVHRIASAGTVKGAGSFCMEWAATQANNIRIDTHEDNYVMQNMLKKQGFVYCGKISTDDGTERLAFQKDTAQE